MSLEEAFFSGAECFFGFISTGIIDAFPDFEFNTAFFAAGFLSAVFAAVFPGADFDITFFADALGAAFFTGALVAAFFAAFVVTFLGVVFGLLSVFFGIFPPQNSVSS